MLPHRRPEFVDLAFDAKKKKIEQLFPHLQGNWQRSRFIYYPSSNDPSMNYDIHCAYRPDGVAEYACPTKYGDKTKNLKALIAHWFSVHKIDLLQLVNLVYDFEVNEQNAKEARARQANQNVGNGMKQKTLDDYKPRSRRDELLIGLTVRPWANVLQPWYRIETCQVSKPILSNPNTVGFYMRDYAYRLQHSSFTALSNRSGIIIYDSGTIWNWRLFPLMFITHGYKPLLISVNPDSVFQGGEHTAVEINRLICQAVHALKTEFNITVRFCVADGAANGQSMAPGRTLENGEQRRAAIATGILLEDEAPVLAPLLTADDDEGERIDDVVPPAGETRLHEVSRTEFIGLDRPAHDKLRFSSPFAKYWTEDPPSLNPPPKFIDVPHILNNITMLVVKNDAAVQAAIEKVDEVLKTLDDNGHLHLIKKQLPRIVVTRWNTYSLLFEAAVTELDALLLREQNQTTDFEDFDDDDVSIIRKGATALLQLKLLSDIAQSNRANFFDNLAIVGRLRSLCSKYPNHPDKTKVLREAIVVPEHTGPKQKKVPESNRWTWLCNDIVTVLASLCPHAMLLQEKSPGGDLNIIRFSQFTMDRLQQWFNPKIANEYYDLCISGGDILVSVNAQLVTADDETPVSANECLTFWTNLGQTYSEFAELAACVVQLFTLPSTEADLERLFSLMKNILTYKRKSLTPTNLEACILVHTLYDNFAADGNLTFRRQPNREAAHVSNVTRAACLGILAFNECIRHNALCAASTLPDKYRVNEVQALLFTNTDQAHFIGGRVKIMIDRNQATNTLREKVPAALIHFKTDIKKGDKAAKTNAHDQQVSCGVCKKLLTDHQDIIEGIDETIECATCHHWIHFSCSHATREAWISIVARANSGVDWNCKSCHHNKRRQAEENRRRRARGGEEAQNVDE